MWLGFSAIQLYIKSPYICNLLSPTIQLTEEITKYALLRPDEVAPCLVAESVSASVGAGLNQQILPKMHPYRAFFYRG